MLYQSCSKSPREAITLCFCFCFPGLDQQHITAHDLNWHPLPAHPPFLPTIILLYSNPGRLFPLTHLLIVRLAIEAAALFS